MGKHSCALRDTRTRTTVIVVIVVVDLEIKTALISALVSFCVSFKWSLTQTSINNYYITKNYKNDGAKRKNHFNYVIKALFKKKIVYQINYNLYFIFKIIDFQCMCIKSAFVAEVKEQLTVESIALHSGMRIHF